MTLSLCFQGRNQGGNATLSLCLQGGNATLSLCLQGGNATLSLCLQGGNATLSLWFAGWKCYVIAMKEYRQACSTGTVRIAPAECFNETKVPWLT